LIGHLGKLSKVGDDPMNKPTNKDKWNKPRPKNLKMNTAFQKKRKESKTKQKRHNRYFYENPK
jgi:hypothetical protein